MTSPRSGSIVAQSWLDGVLPYGGTTPQSAHASRAGAEDARARVASQLLRYLAYLKARPQGATDAEAAAFLEIERTSVCARRNALVKAGLVYPDGFRPGPTGRVKNTVWRAR